MRSIKFLPKTFTLVFFLSALVAGCSLVPGTHISAGKVDNNPDQTVKYIPLTFSVVNNLSSEKIKPVIKADVSFEAMLSQYTYKVGVGDVLNITVWDHPELTIPAGQFRSAGEAGNVVHLDGTIFYPYIGKVPVEGKHVTEIRDILTAKLGQYIEAPQIDVTVAAFRSQKVFVSGAVEMPSNLPITNVPLTVLDALNACGGFSDDADLRSVVLTTSNSTGVIKENLDLYALYRMGDMTQNRLLGPNDVLHVPRNDGLKVFVMGDVVKPQTQIIDRGGLSLAEAINNVGGINEASANAKGIFVLRSGQSDGKTIDVFQLDASSANMLVLSTRFELKPLDIVYVTSAPVARWNKVISQFLPTIRGIYEIDRVANP